MLIVVMGVTGSGKTTVGRSLAARLRLPYYDADAYHTLENRQKIAQDEPLEDEDRWPWLETLANLVPGWEAAGGAVLGCSALKQSYRDVLTRHAAVSRIVFLQLPREEIVERLERRRGHHEFVRDYNRIISGQFRDLEEPADAIVVPGTLPPPELVERVRTQLLAENLLPHGLEHLP